MYYTKNIRIKTKYLTQKACNFIFVVVQLLSHAWLSSTPWTAVRQASLSLTVTWNWFKLTSIDSGMPSTISSSVSLFSSCPQSFPASGSYSLSQFFPSGGQSIGASASASVLPVKFHKADQTQPKLSWGQTQVSDFLEWSNCKYFHYFFKYKGFINK